MWIPEKSVQLYAAVEHLGNDFTFNNVVYMLAGGGKATTFSAVVWRIRGLGKAGMLFIEGYAD